MLQFAKRKKAIKGNGRSRKGAETVGLIADLDWLLSKGGGTQAGVEGWRLPAKTSRCSVAAAKEEVAVAVWG